MTANRFFRRGTLVVLLAACSSNGPSTSGAPSSVVRSINVSSAPLPLAVGATVTLVAIARDADGAPVDTAVIAWSSSAAQVASVSASGVVTAVAAGSATITARNGSLAATATVRVSANPPAALRVIGPASALNAGESYQLVVSATDGSGQAIMPPAVTWTSSRPDIATVSDIGLITGHAIGATLITVSAGALHADLPVVVGAVEVTALELVAPTEALDVGNTYQVTAKERLADGTTIDWLPLTWTSSTPTVVSVTAGGVITALMPGLGEVTATYGQSLGLAFVVVGGEGPVSAAILPASGDPLLVAPGQMMQLTPIEYYNTPARPTRVPGHVSWTSDDPGIARVNDSGVVTGVAAGSTTVRAIVDQVPAAREIKVMATAGTATIRLISAANGYPTVTMHPNSGTTVTLPYGQAVEQTVPAGTLQMSLDGIPPLTSFYYPSIFDVQVFYGFLPAGSHNTFIAVSNTMYASYSGPAGIAWLSDRTNPVPQDSAVVRAVLATDAGYNVYFTSTGGPMSNVTLRGCYLDWPYGYTAYADRIPGDFDIVLQSGKFSTAGPEATRFHVTAPAGHATTFLVTGKDLSSLHVTAITDQ